jgi:hypothetical protein
MASETHLDKEFYSGSFTSPPPFTQQTRLVLSDNGVGIFIQFGPAGCADSELTVITLPPDAVKDLRCRLENALGNIGEL